MLLHLINCHFIIIIIIKQTQCA